MPRGVKEQISISSPFDVLYFQDTNVPDAAGTAKAVEPASLGYVALFAGSIIIISAVSNAAFGAGPTVSWRPTVNTVAKTALSVTLSSTAISATARVGELAIPFKAGDIIGVDRVKTGTVSPTTNDIVICLGVIYDDVFT